MAVFSLMSIVKKTEKNSKIPKFEKREVLITIENFTIPSPNYFATLNPILTFIVTQNQPFFRYFEIQISIFRQIPLMFGILTLYKSET